MKSSILHSGILLFALGLILSLPSLILDASASNIKTTGGAINLIVGNVVKDFGNIDTTNFAASIFSIIPTILIIIGLIFIVVYIFFRFFVI